MKRILAEMNKRLLKLGLVDDLTYACKGFKLNIASKSLNASTLNVNYWIFYHKNMTPRFNIEDTFIRHDGIRMLLDIEGVKEYLEQQIRVAEIDTCPVSKSMLMQAVRENVSGKIPFILICEPGFDVDYISDGGLDTQLRCVSQRPFILLNAYPSGFKRHSLLIISCNSVHNPNNPRRQMSSPIPQGIMDILERSGEYSNSYPVEKDMRKFADYIQQHYVPPSTPCYVHAIPIDWAACLFPTWDMNMDIKHVLLFGTDEYRLVYPEDSPTGAYKEENKILLKKRDRDTNSFIYACR